MSFYLQTDFVVHTCIYSGCGAVWAVTSEFNRCRRNDHKSFYCPNGHAQAFRTESPEETLKRELAAVQHDRDWYKNRANNESNAHQHTKNRLNATRGVVTRVKRRIGKGVCPCCTRSFSNVAAHMATKHPDYHTEAVSP